MKRTKHIILVFFVGLFLTTLNLFGQQVLPLRKSEKFSPQTEVYNSFFKIGSQQKYNDKSGNFFLTENFNPNFHSKDILDVIDTINFPLEGTPAIYTADSGGYVTGNNFYQDISKSNFYEYQGDCLLSGVLFGFGIATGGGSDIEIAVWDDSGPANSPGDKIGSNTVALSSIINDISNQQMTYIEFSNPVVLTSSFYVGAILPDNPGDTLAIISNTDGDTNPGIAWEQWENGTWYPISSMDTWGLNLAQAIFPIVDLPLMSDFSSNSTSIHPGETVLFIDESTGNPTSWHWSFEGGEPTTSTEQNPEVIYNFEGDYDVTLICVNDTISDTLTITNYISVTTSNITIDTINYPLEGSYAVYVTNDGGFVSGNNEFGDLAKANYFFNNQEKYITGMLIDFAYTTGGNPNIEIAVWADDGGFGPGNKIGSNVVSLNDIADDVENEESTYVSFIPPINVTTSFYAGCILPTAVGDTLVVWSNIDGETMPGIAWEQWNNNSWYPFNSPDSWEQNVALAIFPIVQNSLNVNENLVLDNWGIYPNPSSGSFKLSISNSDIKNVVVKVYNLHGICLLKQLIQNTNTEIGLDLNHLADGLYLVKLNYENRNSYKKILIK